MAVALDAAGTELSTTTAGAAINYTGITVGSVSNPGLVFVINFDDGRVTAPAATWDNGGTNQSMTLLKFLKTASGNFGAVAIFGLANPIAGNKTLRCTWSTVNSQTGACAVSFSGVDQTGGTTSFPNSATATGSSTTPSVTITSASGNAVVAVHSSAAAGTFSSVNNTQIYRDNAFTNTSGAANRASGAATVTMTATNTASGQWVSAGTDILAAAAAAATGIAWYSMADRPVYGKPVRDFIAPAFIAPTNPTFQNAAFQSSTPPFYGKQLRDFVPPALTPQFTPAVGISGISWFEPLDIPVYGKPSRDFIAPAFTEPVAVTVGIMGNAWYEPWDIPVYGKPSRDFVPLAFTMPNAVTVGVSGNAWFVREDTYKKKVVPFDDPPSRALQFTNQTVSITGMAWFEPLDIPVYGKPLRDFVAPAHTVPVRTTITASYNVSDTIWLPDPPLSLPIAFEQPIFQQQVGISGMAWFEPFDVYPKRPKVDSPPAPLLFLAQTLTISFNVSDTIWLPDPPLSPPSAFVSPNFTQPVGIAGMAWFTPPDFAKSKIVSNTPPPAWDPQFVLQFVNVRTSYFPSDTIWLPDPPLSPPAAYQAFTPNVVWEFFVSDTVVLPDPLLTVPPAWDPKFTFQQTVGISGMAWFEPPDFAKGLVVNYTPPPAWDPQFIFQVAVEETHIVKFIGVNVGHMMLR